jgi:hypothetical protein
MLSLLAPLLLAPYSLARISWSEAIDISDTTASSWFPALTVDSKGRVHVVWTENWVDERQRLAIDSLLYTVWDGESWSATNDLYTSKQAEAYTLRPAIVTDRTDTLHLLYRYPTIFHYTSAPAESAWSARAWSDSHRISGRGESDWTDLAMDSKDIIHALWSESVTYILPGGVSVLLPGNSAFDKADDSWTTYTSSDGLADNNVLDITVDAWDLRWFVTDGGLGVLSADGGHWTTFTVADGLLSEQIQKVQIDKEGHKWLAMHNGVSVLNDSGTPFDKSDDVWITYTAADGLAGDNVLDITADTTGQVWFATDKGASVFSIADGQWMSFTSADGLVSDSVQAIFVDQAGHKWFGTPRGASVLNDGETPFVKSDDVWKTFTLESGLVSNNVRVIAADDRGHKWFGTTSGLSLLDDGGTPFDDSDDVWTTFTTRDDLPDNRVTAINTDAGGNMWVGTAAGVSVFSPDNDLRLSYTVDDGVAQRFITTIAVDQGGGVWLGTLGSEEDYISSDVFYRHSADRGRTWSSPKNLSRSRSPIGNSLHLHIDAQDRIHVVWDEAQSCGYLSSSDSGETWSQRATFYSDAGIPHQIVVGVDGEGQTLVVWRIISERTRLDEQLPIYYQLSPDSGFSWSEPAPIPNVLARAFNDTPYDAYDMAGDSAGHLHLVAVGRAGTADTALSVLHTEWNGNFWSAPTSVFSTTDYPERPVITVSRGNRLHLVWFVRDAEHLFTGGGDYQVWYSRGRSAAPSVPPPPSPTPLPTPTVTPTPVPLPSPTPYPTRAPGSGELATNDLYTESDEILQLAVALLPLVLLILLIVLFRRGWFSRLLR